MTLTPSLAVGCEKPHTAGERRDRGDVALAKSRPCRWSARAVASLKHFGPGVGRAESGSGSDAHLGFGRHSGADCDLWIWADPDQGHAGEPGPTPSRRN